MPLELVSVNVAATPFILNPLVVHAAALILPEIVRRSVVISVTLGDVVPTGPPVPLGVPVKSVATPVPSPLTPVLIGSPVQDVSVPLDGVPSGPPL